MAPAFVVPNARLLLECTQELKNNNHNIFPL